MADVILALDPLDCRTIEVREQIPYLPSDISAVVMKDGSKCNGCGVPFTKNSVALRCYIITWCVGCAKEYYNDPKYTKGKVMTKPSVIDI